MTHYTVAIIVPPDALRRVEPFVHSQMTPYDETITVPPYVCYTIAKPEEDLAESINRFRLIIERAEPRYDLNHCRQMIAKLQATTPVQHYKEYVEDFDRLDSRGRPISTSNPCGKWDWYVIGGRWDGWIHDRETDGESLADNMASTEHTLKLDKTTHAIITPDGVWHERGRMGWWAMLLTEAEDWDDRVRSILSQFPGHQVVIVDAHV